MAMAGTMSPSLSMRLAFDQVRPGWDVPWRLRAGQ